MPLADEDDAAPWTAPPSRRRERSRRSPGRCPSASNWFLGNQIYIAKDALPPGLRNRLLRLAAFQNPEFYKAQAMRLPTYDKPRIIACAEDHPHTSACRAAVWTMCRGSCRSLEISAVIRDERCAGTPLDVAFRGELRPEQEAAAEAMLAHDTGVLSATTAFGKTVIAAWLIAQRGVNTLVLVHRRQLLEQWVERLSTFLDLPPKAIGRIGGGRKKPTGSLDVALIQSLVRKGVVDDLVGEYGHLIVDECHHLSAHSFEQVARRAKAKFVTGLSATVTRKDGHHPIIFMQCGPVRYRVDAKEQAAARPFEHTVLVRPTAFRPPGAADPDVRIQFHELYDELIADDAAQSAHLRGRRAGRSGRPIARRADGAQRAPRLLGRPIVAEHPPPDCAARRHGQEGSQAIVARLAAIPENEERVLLATGRYIGEGFDDARLDTLFLTLPVSWRGTIAQYVGRLHRLHDRKREVRVYDYADLNVPMLARMFDRRCRGYEAVGYTILLPASAVPGWPAEVPLPVDPQWKSDYAASVRRLVRDGVDAPLANLFVHVARTVLPDAEGVERARSATRGVPVSPAGDAAGDRRAVPPECRVADSLRRAGADGSRSALCRWHAWPSNWTARSIWPMPRPTAATGARTFCCRKTATSCCGSWPKMWASTSMRCSTRSCGRSPIGEANDEVKPIKPHRRRPGAEAAGEPARARTCQPANRRPGVSRGCNRIARPRIRRQGGA